MPFTESFESDGRGTRYGVLGGFITGSNLFARIDPSPDVPQTDGTFAFAAEHTQTDAEPLEAVTAHVNTTGYGNLKPDELVQLKALEITPEFIAGFERIGYGRLPIDTLVQLKAMDITPDYVRAVEQGGALPSPDHLVQLKAVSDDIRKR